MPQFILPPFPAIIELTEGGAPYGFTITPDGTLAGAAKIRWKIVPQGRIPGGDSDFIAASGVLDFASGATAGQDITLTPDDDVWTEVEESFVLRLYEVVGEDDGVSTSGESDDIRLGGDVIIELTDNDTADSSTRIGPRDNSGAEDVQLAARNGDLTMGGGGGADIFVITRYQSGDVDISDSFPGGSYNLIKFDFGVEIEKAVLNENQAGPFLIVQEMDLVLSTGATITISAPASNDWRFQFGDGGLIQGYVALKEALGLAVRPGGLTVPTDQLRQPVEYVLGTAENPYYTVPFPSADDDVETLPESVVKSPVTLSGAGGITGEVDIIGLGANASFSANGGGGDDVYVVTRFQLGDVSISDSFPGGSHNLIKFDFGVEIEKAVLNENQAGPFLIVQEMDLVLSTGATITISAPASNDWRFQFGDGGLIQGYVALKEALGLAVRPGGLTVPTDQLRQPVEYVLGTAENPFTIPFPSDEPTTPDPPPPEPIGPDTGDYYFKWVVAVDADDSGFQRFTVSDDRPAEVPPGEDAFAGNDLFELDDAVPADTVIDGGDGDDVYLVKSALAQNITIQDVATGGLGYNLVRFDDDVAVTEIAAGASPFQGAGSSLLSMTITMANESNDSVVVTVWLQNAMRFQVGETGAVDMAEEFFNKYAEGFASVAIDDATPQVGAELTARITDVHGVDESEAITWRWEASADSGGTWATIGANRNTYLLQAGDVGKIIRVTAGYTDNGGNAETVASQSTEAVETPVDAVFISVANLAIEENLDGSATAVDIGRVVAEDSNAGDAVAYGLEGVGGTAAPAGFEIGAETGVIRYAGTGLDHEGTPENGIAMVVVATSTGADGTDTEIRREIAVEVEDVNDAPELDVNAGLSVNPGQTLAITESDLHASDEDDSDGDDDIVFTVRTPPGRGALQLFGDHDDDSNTDDVWHDLSAGGFFTQTDINEGHVRYVNTGGTAAEDDSFTFAVGDGDITLPDAPFAIDII